MDRLLNKGGAKEEKKERSRDKDKDERKKRDSEVISE